MRIATAVLVISVSPVSFVAAGVVTFQPAAAVIDTGTGTTTATFDVIISEADLLTDFVLGLDLRLLSDALPFVDWEYIGPQEQVIICDPVPCHEQGFLAREIYDFGVFSAPVRPPFAFGRMTIDAAGFPNGEYVVTVDPEYSVVGGRVFELDPLTGSLPITVIPDPSAGILLLFGLTGVVSRCRRVPNSHQE